MSAECFLGIKPCDVSDQNHATTLRAATSPLSRVPFIDVKRPVLGPERLSL